MLPGSQNAWYVARGGQTFGPYTWEQMAEHARGGRIGRGDKVLDPRSGSWARPTEIPGLFGSGGAAAAPVGVTAAVKAIAVLVISLAVLATGATVFAYSTGGWLRVYEKDPLAGVREYVDATSTPSATAVVPPEGLAYKGTFKWESAEGVGLKDLQHEDQCYLWIHTTDDGTQATLTYGPLLLDEYHAYLVTQNGSSWVFESPERSLVGRVRIAVDMTDSGMSGTVSRIDHVGAFLGGTLSGTRITYEQYKAAIPG